MRFLRFLCLFGGGVAAGAGDLGVREEYVFDGFEDAHEFGAVSGKGAQPVDERHTVGAGELADLLQTVPVPEAHDFLPLLSAYFRVLLQLERLQQSVDRRVAHVQLPPLKLVLLGERVHYVRGRSTRHTLGVYGGSFLHIYLLYLFLHYFFISITPLT